MTSDVPVHPVQTKVSYQQAMIPQTVTMRAYEVYKHIHGEQTAMITGGCRGGFCIGEIIGFLYAYPFPKEQWEARCQEAWRGMKNL